MAKINIDENQQIAAQLRIQSIPAVFAFKDKQPVDAFQGVIPEKEVIKFLEKSIGGKLSNNFEDFYDRIKILFDAKSDEITKIYSEAFPNEQARIIKTLVEIDPSRSSKYQDIVKQSEIGR